MTIEEAIGMSAAQLEAMTDEDLKKHFDHYLVVTRPENAPKAVQQTQRFLEVDPKMAQAARIAATLGIQLPVFKKLGRK
jgi:hypothetical protein